MNKNTAKIRAGLRQLAYQQAEIRSGTVVAGSVDLTAFVMAVQPADGGEPVTGVGLNTIAGDGNGWILVPKDGSNVVIGSIDGPGEWVLLRASELVKATLILDNVALEVDGNNVSLQNNSVLFQMTDSVFKLNTSSENLFGFLRDLVTYLTVLTVPTPAGTSGVPVNVSDFSNLLTRLNNLLSS